MGSRFSINLAKIVVIRPEVHWVTPTRAAAKDIVTQLVHRLNLKDSRHGHLNQNHIFLFISPLTLLSKPDMRLLKD